MSGPTPSTVRDLMTETVIVLQHDEVIRDPTEDMDRFRLRQLPVLDGDRVVGLVTHREVVRALAPRSPDTPGQVVREIMSRDVATVSPDTPVADALDLLIARRTGCLVVVDAAGAPLGIVTEYDFLRLARALLRGAPSPR